MDKDILLIETKGSKDMLDYIIKNIDEYSNEEIYFKLEYIIDKLTKVKEHINKYEYNAKSSRLKLDVICSDASMLHSEIGYIMDKIEDKATVRDIIAIQKAFENALENGEDNRKEFDVAVCFRDFGIYDTNTIIDVLEKGGTHTAYDMLRELIDNVELWNI